jgi:hypothetical protein
MLLDVGTVDAELVGEWKVNRRRRRRWAPGGDGGDGGGGGGGATGGASARTTRGPPARFMRVNRGDICTRGRCVAGVALGDRQRRRLLALFVVAAMTIA